MAQRGPIAEVSREQFLTDLARTYQDIRNLLCFSMCFSPFIGFSPEIKAPYDSASRSSLMQRAQMEFLGRTGKSHLLPPSGVFLCRCARLPGGALLSSPHGASPRCRQSVPPPPQIFRLHAAAAWRAPPHAPTCLPRPASRIQASWPTSLSSAWLAASTTSSASTARCVAILSAIAPRRATDCFVRAPTKRLARAGDGPRRLLRSQ